MSEPHPYSLQENGVARQRSLSRKGVASQNAVYRKIIAPPGSETYPEQDYPWLCVTFYAAVRMSGHQRQYGTVVYTYQCIG